MFNYLMGMARMLRDNLNTEWTRNHASMYGSFKETVGQAYLHNDLSKEEHDKLIAVFEDMKGENNG